jgi:hypothetical protein
MPSEFPATDTQPGESRLARLWLHFAPNTNSAFTHLQSERQQLIVGFAHMAFARRHDATPIPPKGGATAFHFMNLYRQASMLQCTTKAVANAPEALIFQPCDTCCTLRRLD